MINWSIALFAISQTGRYAMHKMLAAAGFILAAGTSALAQQTPQPPELVGIPSARAGAKAERFVFDYFKTSADSVFNVARVTVAPGQFLPVHTHSGPEFHYVISGEFEETGAHEPPIMLKAGEWGYAKEGVPHGLKNTGTQPATFLAVIVGRKGVKLTAPYRK
jgi:quercetin dioxygenase-like cupin family protein